MYGNHEFCQEWCGFISNPEKYKHCNLPYGKDLSDESLHITLSKLVNSMDANKLANLSSTQANESFNHTVASKARKQDTTQIHQVCSLDFVQVLVRKMKDTST